ncbi:hypothetical protein BDW62DRAFT_215657 [Aspergillus aurantiobrunneus]
MPAATLPSAISEPWLQLELRRTCANVLQVDVKDVDPQRSFLALGGDSLLAIKVLAQCRAQGITINIADIMAAGTMESLYALAQASPGMASSDGSHDGSMPDSGALTPTTEPGSTLIDTLSPDVEAKLSVLSGSPNHCIQAIVPCSAIQDRILVSQLQNPHLYSCCFVLRFTHSHPGLPVDARRLGVACPGHYNQVILAAIRPSIQYHEGPEHLSSPEFNLHNPLAFEPHSIPHRVQLVQASPSEVYMKLDVSHVLVDGQSAEVLLKDLSDAYRNGELSAAPLSYANYVSSHLQAPSPQGPSSKDADRAVDMPPVAVPMDRPNEGLHGFQTVSVNVPLDSQLVQSVCARYPVTLATVCQLAWGLVLRCYAGTDNVCFSYVNSGRSMSILGVHDVIGPIVQTSLCSIQLAGADVLSRVLQQIHKDPVHNLSQISPLESSTSTSKSARQLSNTTMSFRHALDDRAVRHASLSVTIQGKANPTDCDISLGISATPDGLSIDLDFWSARLDQDRAKAILGAFEAAIRGIVGAPDGIISDISLLTPSDVVQLAHWNSHIPKPQRICVHEKVIETSKLQPSAVAVNSWDGDLTYHELTAQASALAHHLRNELGVGPERFIGICMDKSRWSIVSMLAVLMAGGIVVPLGVSHPRARVKALLMDTAAVALLVDARNAVRLVDLELESTFMLTMDQQLLSSLPNFPEPPVSGVTPDNAAWVIYTSGSTGAPKGVVLLHQDISTSVLAHGALFGANCATRAAQFAAYTFDVSLSDIVMALFHGGCVCVFSEESRMDSLTDALRALAVNYVNLTPTVLGLLDPAALPDIPGIVKKWSPQARVFNSVGPSECTIIAVAAGPVTDPAQAANVGYPTGTRLWVTMPTDPNQLCPVGVPGELLIEGPMLSRGYLNDPEKTAAAFISNPAFKVQFQDSQRRMYRSGDLVRQNKDGSLVHMGRRDTQVKIRGQRVEIGEIEYWIMQRPRDIRRVAVLLIERKLQKENNALVAAIEFQEDNEFFNACPGGNPEDPPAAPQLLPLTESLSSALHQLRTALLEHLPPYMSPAMYAPVSQLPLNLSGKIDRRAVTRFINDQDGARLQQYLAVSCPHKGPSTETEHKLQQLWAKTLGFDISHVSADSHFFHIGGDSMAAMRVVAAARDVELVLRVADLFEYPRLLDLARVVEGRVLDDHDEGDPAPFSVWSEGRGIHASAEEDKLVQIAQLCGLAREPIEDVLPCTPLQEGLIALTAHQPTAYIDRQAFALAETVDVARFWSAWQAVVGRTSTLRTRIVSGPETRSLQVVVVPGEFVWRESTSLGLYLETDRQTGMATGRPLNRFALVNEPDGRRFFVAAVYLGQEPAPVASFTRFIHYIERSQDQLAGNTSADFPASPSINYQPRPQQRHQHAISLPRPTSSSGVMLPDLLRGAWALVVHQYTGKVDPVFAVALSGRNAPVHNVTSIPGPALTTVPVWIRVDPGQSVQDFLQAVRQQAVGMIPKMVREAAAAVDVKHLFVVQPAGQDDRMFKIPGVDDHVVAVDEFDSYGLNVECTLSVVRLMSQFESVLHQLVQGQESLKTKDIDFLSPKDVNQLQKLDEEPLSQPLDACLRDVIAAVALSQPQAPAIEAWDGSLTYAQLHSSASTLAIHLMHLGVGPETAIPVCMGKSVWAVVSFLAVLQAGRVVVPLAVNHPLPRIATIIADTKARVVLVDSKQAERLDELIASHDLSLSPVSAETLDNLPAAASISNPSITSNNAAWIVFTPVSTGQPKGVVLTHSNLSTAVKSHGARFGLGTYTRTIQFAAHTFDAILQDYFTTLANGGTVCVPSEEGRMSNLAGTMRAMNTNFANLTSSVARLLTPEQVPGLKLLVLAGEQIQDSVVETWYRHADVLNVYGPSECSINSTCNGPIMDVADAQSIDHGLGARIWVADPANPQRLCPIGTPGELLIQGPGLAREYLGDQAKTDRAFIHNPEFASRFGLSGCRVYRTGDLGKQTEDGKILYMGRMDTQIKVRGQRVEISEIEHWITHQLASVDHVAVVAISRGGDKQLRLAAVVEFQDGHKADSDTFLPAFMVPSLYIPVDRISLNANGKLDLLAIRQMVEEIPTAQLDQYLPRESRESRVLSSTDMEKALQRAWANALGVEEDAIGADDDFFQLGGDLVVAMHLSATSRQDASLAGLAVGDIFQHPRLSDLAVFLEQRGNDWEDRDAMEPKEDESPFALLQEAPYLGSL